MLRLSIEDYSTIKGDPMGNKINTLLFMDHIVRLTICRAQMCLDNRMYITAEKFLSFADKTLDHLK